MALNPNIPLAAGQIQSPLFSLGQGIQQGQQMAARKQQMDINQQQAGLREDQARVLEADRNRQALAGVFQGLMEIEIPGDEQATIAARQQALPTVMARGSEAMGINLPVDSITADDLTNQGLRSGLSTLGFKQEQGDGISEFQRRNLELQERRLASQEGREERAMKQRGQELELKRDIESRQQTKLSSPAEKSLITAQDSVVSAQRAANNYSLLADDFERLNTGGGLGTTVTESFKKILGTQDDVTEFRRRFNKVRLSEGLKNLPPGPATDRDVKEAFKGVPPENAPPEQVVSFLKGAARLARLDAAYNQFKADHISETGSVRNLNKVWRSTMDSERLGREISMMEIYETAQNRGLSPEDVMERLGL